MNGARSEPTQPPGLELDTGGTQRILDSAQLLATPEAAEVKVAADPFYGKVPRIYRGVPITSLIGAAGISPKAMVQFRANDGFVAAIPAALVLNTDPRRPMAWLAIDTPDHPWPPLPAKGQATPGPFALIWTGPGAERVWTERWPYQIAHIAITEPAAARWPQIAVDTAPPHSAVRRGQEVYVAQCMVCHRFAGAGDAQVGPDLNRPMSPTQYFTSAALKQYIRNPASVRDWPGRQMTGFTKDSLSDPDLEALVAFLAFKAGR